MKVLTVLALITAITSGSFLAGWHTAPNKVTKAAYNACLADPYIQIVGATEMYKAMGATKAQLLEQLAEAIAGGLDVETVKLARKALDHVYDKKNENEATVGAFVECLNK